jgi:hypothetical protein
MLRLTASGGSLSAGYSANADWLMLIGIFVS